MRRRPDIALRAHPAVPRAPRPTGGAALRTTLLAAVVGSLLALLLGTAPASAHASFTGSDPAEGSTLAALPAAVVMSYSEDIAPQFVETAVVAPDGTTLPTEATVQGPDVTVDLAGADLPDLAGPWQVVARVVSVDGHPVEHTTGFVVEQAAAPATTQATGDTDGAGGTATPGATTTTPPSEATEAPTGGAAPEDEASASTTDLPVDPAATLSSGLPRWVVVAGAAALVLAAAAALLVQLRRRPPTG